MSPEQLKLSKPLVSAMTAAGYLSVTEIQQKTVSRMIGGQDILVTAPEGAGKTTAYILAMLMKLKYNADEAPRVMILVADRERGEEVIRSFQQLAGNRGLRITGVFGTGGMEGEINELTDGTDVVVALPTRARAVYLKLGLNLNKLQTLIVDDAELIVKQGMQLPVCELARSAGRCQHLVFTTVVHGKLLHMTEQFMEFPVTVTVDEVGGRVQTHELMLYEVPDFATKVSLLNLLLENEEVFDKAVIFVNTRLHADQLRKHLRKRTEGEIAVLKPLFFDELGFDDMEEFKDTAGARILIVANEVAEGINLEGITSIFHFEMPEKLETLLSRIVKKDEQEMLSFVMATDLELADVRKAEQAIGFKMPVLDLPETLVVHKSKKSGMDKKRIQKEKTEFAEGNGAFHKKKEQNAKTFNYGMGAKAVMNKKKKHG